MLGGGAVLTKVSFLNYLKLICWVISVDSDPVLKDKIFFKVVFTGELT